MGVIYRSSLRTTRMNSVKTDIDSGGAAGKIIIQSAATVTLAVLPLSFPCGTVSGDVLTFSAITSDTSADATGTATKAEIQTSAGTAVVTGLTVGTSGANINMNSTSITAGQQVDITSASITHNTSGV